MGASAWAGVDVRAPKCGSERTVFIPDELVRILAAHVKARGLEPTSWLFSVDGKPAHQNTVGHQYRRACKSAGVEGLTLHSLRHFYASGLIAQGCDVVTVQRALGHAKATTTLSTCAHLWPTAEDRTRKAAAKLASSVLNLADSVRTKGEV